MTLDVAMLGDIDGLHEALLHRGILAGYRFYIPTTVINEVMERLAGELRSFPNAVQALENAPASCGWLGTAATSEDRFPTEGTNVRILSAPEPSNSAFNGTVLVVHDMLPAASNSEDGAMFDQWNRACHANETPPLPEQRRYWCSIADVATALSRCLPHLKGTSTYHVAGRRGWTLADTFAEFSRLAQRTHAGASGAFRQEHLLADGGPVVHATSVTKEEGQEGIRPDLAPFHRFLEQTTGEGWRPSMPLRQTLMLVLAAMDEAHA